MELPDDMPLRRAEEAERAATLKVAFEATGAKEPMWRPTQKKRWSAYCICSSSGQLSRTVNSWSSTKRNPEATTVMVIASSLHFDSQWAATIFIKNAHKVYGFI